MHVGFDLIFEDDQILVVNKPAGIGTQAPAKFDSLEARIRRYQFQAGDQPTPYLGIPHRLDRCVSGAMVFAKRKKAALKLSKQFERREVAKTYQTLVTGLVDPAIGEWRDYLRKIPNQPRAEIVDEHHKEGRLAIMRYQVEHRAANASHLRITLETGRMHQIRIQCSSRGFPVLGDEMYSSTESFGPEYEHERERSIALHASQLRFVHPTTRENLSFHAPFPMYWPTHRHD